MSCPCSCHTTIHKRIGTASGPLTPEMKKAMDEAIVNSIRCTQCHCSRIGGMVESLEQTERHRERVTRRGFISMLGAFAVAPALIVPKQFSAEYMYDVNRDLVWRYADDTVRVVIFAADDLRQYGSAAQKVWREQERVLIKPIPLEEIYES